VENLKRSEKKAKRENWDFVAKGIMGNVELRNTCQELVTRCHACLSNKSMIEWIEMDGWMDGQINVINKVFEF